MDRDVFNKSTSKERSGWLKDAKRRNKWRFIRKPIFNIRVIYYRLKRKSPLTDMFLPVKT